MVERCEADYVVVGGGAVGMAFADVILSESDASIVIVDRRAQPGGHWNDAYSFVRLHQPSASYGVNSKPLGRDRKDETGPNAGLFELASGSEICAYFDQVMRDQFLPSGRVRYFPMSEYADGRITSLLTGDQISVHARKKVVDAGYLGSEVPSTRRPTFTVTPGAMLVPINDLTRISQPHSGYVIIGAGKTGIDACLWLLDRGVDPTTISWVRPRDTWLTDRANVQGGEEFFAQTLGSFATQLEVMALAESVDDLFARLEDAGQLLRIDQDYWPTMYQGATVTRRELEALRLVTKVIRAGHVTHIDREAILLEQGSAPIGADWLCVDCSAPGLRKRPPVPIFEQDRITLQYVTFGGRPPYSAAITARIELEYEDDASKNAMCQPLPMRSDLIDLPRNMLGDLKVRHLWSRSPALRSWMVGSRLDQTMGVASTIDPADHAKVAVLNRYQKNVGPARSRLEKLMAASDPQSCGAASPSPN